MTRKVFYSFHYKPDNWRASQVRNMGVVEGNVPCSDNGWEAVTRRGDAAIEKWIADEMSGRSCTIVLVGEETARRKWIDYEIKESWRAGKGVFGIRIHNLLDRHSTQCSPGASPFAHLTLDGHPFSSIVKLYNPPYSSSKNVYEYIKENLASWIEKALNIRRQFLS